ncbi:hypothetical protein UlMin_014984 [Ulmus minor]
MGSNAGTSPTSRHVVLFPFMSKGHTIPLLHLARLLLNRRIAVTLFTTQSNRPFIATSLADTSAAIINLPFPENLPDIPAGIESTDKLPSMSLFYSFANSTSLIQTHFERALETLLPPVSFIVSDAFLWWTQESASKFGIPRLVFYGMAIYPMVLLRSVFRNNLLSGVRSNKELFTITTFPWIKITIDDMGPEFSNPEKNPQASKFVSKASEATLRSFGIIVNNFYELEPIFVDYFNEEYFPKAWCIGPLCLADEKSKAQKLSWPVQWLDQKLEEEKSVLYVAFGSQAEISGEKLGEIAKGLEESEVNFLWVLRKKEAELPDGFEERVKERGLIVKDWVDQREILAHDCVKGFLSHCGWNSVMESVCAGVPILAWPMMAEQHLNARMVAEEIKVALRVETCDGSVRGFVKWDGLKKMVKELMEGDLGNQVRKKVEEVAEMAKMAMEEERGSSWRTLEELIGETRKGCNQN